MLFRSCLSAAAHPIAAHATAIAQGVAARTVEFSGKSGDADGEVELSFGTVAFSIRRVD